MNSLGFYPANVLLPTETDLTKWSVVACDQYTSQPDYWQEVESFVGDAPSTLRMIVPELYLEQPGVEQRIAAVNAAMDRYLADGIFRTVENFIYVRRTLRDGKIRRGLIGVVDLEKYDFTKPFAEQVDDWKAGKIEKNDTLVVGSTPEVFQKVGFNALPVT